MNPSDTKQLVDGHGRVIDYLRLAITDRCNLRCTYCMPKGGARKLSYDEILRHEELIAVAKAAVELGVRKIRITGGEPLVKKNIVSLAGGLAAIDDLQILAMTTNATLLAPLAQDLFDAGVRKLNISFDTLDEKRFAEGTRGGRLGDALAGLDAALAAGFTVKLNTVLSHREFEDYAAMIDMTRSRGVGIRFIEQMKFGDVDAAAYVGEKELVEFLRTRGDVQLVEPGSSHAHVRYYRLDGYEVGFISPRSSHFCGTCNKLRLTPHGRLRFCLAGEEHVDLRAVLRRDHTDEDLKDAIRSAVAQKPLAGPWENAQSMWRIGG